MGKPEGMTAMDHHQMAMPGMMDHAEVGRFMGLEDAQFGWDGARPAGGGPARPESSPTSVWSDELPGRVK